MILDRITHICINIQPDLTYHVCVSGYRIVVDTTTTVRNNLSGVNILVDELIQIVSLSSGCDIVVAIENTPPSIAIRSQPLPRRDAIHAICSACIHPICALPQIREIILRDPLLPGAISLAAITSARSASFLFINSSMPIAVAPFSNTTAPFKVIRAPVQLVAKSELAFISSIATTTTHLQLAIDQQLLPALALHPFPSVVQLSLLVVVSSPYEVDSDDDGESFITTDDDIIASAIRASFPSLDTISVDLYGVSRSFLLTFLTSAYPHTNAIIVRHLLSDTLDASSVNYESYDPEPQEHALRARRNEHRPSIPFSPATAILSSHLAPGDRCVAGDHCETLVLGDRLAAFCLAVNRLFVSIAPLVVVRSIFSHLTTRKDRFSSLETRIPF